MIRTYLLLATLAPTIACAHVPTDKERSMAKSQYDIAVENFRQARNRDALRALLSAVELNPKKQRFGTCWASSTTPWDDSKRG